jgi:hypothetical protein
MDIRKRFLAYADAFEQSYQDDDWSRLAQYFTEQSSYDAGDGVPAEGREAVLEKLASAVNGLDRQMDNRNLDFNPPTVEGDTVSLNWTVLYTKTGLPDLEISGSEYARFEGDRIAQLWDELKSDSLENLAAWMAANGGALEG